MDKNEDENYEDGELTSDSENENLVINNQNNDFQNLLTDFESHMKKSNLNENRSQKIKSDKKACKISDNGKSSFVEEDELIFVRGASPPPSVVDEDFIANNKELNFSNSELIHQSSYSKYKNRKLRKINSEIYSSSSSSFTQQLKICKFYLHDKCGKTEKTCTFLHSQFPCKYYYLGINCPDGNKCKLSHGEVLSDEMKEALLLHIQIAPREILGDFKMSADHAKKLLNNRHVELTLKNKGVKKIDSENFDDISTAENGIRSNSVQHKLITTKHLLIPNFLKIDNFNDILNEKQIKSLKKIGVSYSYQLLTLSMIELNACGINIMEVIKIQERIKEKDKINSSQIKNNVEHKKDVDMRNFPTLLSSKSEDTLLAPELSTEPLLNSIVEDIDEEEESNLIIDEEASNMSEGELELLKKDIQNKINQTQEDVADFSKEINVHESYNNYNNDNVNNNYVGIGENNLFSTDTDDPMIMDLSKKSMLENKGAKKYKVIPSTNACNESNNTEFIFSEGSENLKKLEENNYAKDLKKKSTNHNTIDDIKIITAGDFAMRLPFNHILQDYKPATECDGSFTSHPLIPWKLIEMLIPAKEPISLELIEKLQKSNDPRCRKQSIHKEQYSFDGNMHCLLDETSLITNNNLSAINSINDNNNKVGNNVDFIDPRKNHIKSSTYESISNNQVPSVMQILQHYLHRSVWYNEQNSKTKMEINELIAELAKNLKKFKQQNIPNKKFNLCEVKYFNKIQNVLSNLKIFIDSNGCILPQKPAEINYFDNTGIVTNNFIGSFETFWNGIQQSQQPLPVISNLVPIGSFQAPAPLNFGKPGLLGMHPNDVNGIEFNNPFRATTAPINNNNIHFGNNIFYGNQNFALRFEGNYKPIFQQDHNIQNQNFRMIQRGNQRLNERNLVKNRNNFKIRNNNNNNFLNRYNNVRHKKSTNNNCNSFEVSDISKYIEDDNKNSCKCSAKEENKDEFGKTRLIKEINENIKGKCLKNSKSDEEDWDVETENNNLFNYSSNAKDPSYKQNKNIENNISPKSLEINNRENWGSDDINDLSTEKNKTFVVNYSSCKKNNVKNEWTEVEEKKLKLSIDYDNCKSKKKILSSGGDQLIDAIPNSKIEIKNFNIVESDEKIRGTSLEDSEEVVSFFHDTKGEKIDEDKQTFDKYFVNNIAISKSAKENDSEEEWD